MLFFFFKKHFYLLSLITMQCFSELLGIYTYLYGNYVKTSCPVFKIECVCAGFVLLSEILTINIIETVS